MSVGDGENSCLLLAAGDAEQTTRGAGHERNQKRNKMASCGPGDRFCRASSGNRHYRDSLCAVRNYSSAVDRQVGRLITEQAAPDGAAAPYFFRPDILAITVSSVGPPTVNKIRDIVRSPDCRSIAAEVFSGVR